MVKNDIWIFMEFNQNACYNDVEVMRMIIKYRNRPAKIAGYEALLKRLPSNHVKRGLITEKLGAINAGAGGEERVDKLLSFFEPDYPYLVIQDLSLPDQSQIDSLIITQEKIIILEIKNLGGELRLRSNPSVLTQKMPNGKQRFFKSPVVQAETAKIKLEKLLKRAEYNLPVDSVVVMAYSSQFIHDVPADAKVWTADELLLQLYRMDIQNKNINMSQLQAIGDYLLAADRRYQPFPLAPKLDIALTEIDNGVFCPRCRLRKMERNIRRWECKPCHLFSKDAHLEAIDEWFMLCKPTINTKECKDFLGLTDLDAAKRVLKRKGLIETGGRRHRLYLQQHGADLLLK